MLCLTYPESHILAGWIEIEINLLVILNSFITVMMVCFTMCVGLDCTSKLLFCCPAWMANL